MPGSRKAILSATALGLGLLMYAGWATGLGRLAVWAESRFEAYPYQSGEDPLRWLLPSVFGRDRPDILILGGSAVREGMLYEVMSEAVQGRVVNGGLSNGTLDEFTLGLDYIRRVYGPDALPRHIVVGMSKRVLGNFPRSFGPNVQEEAYAPLTRQLHRYSSQFGVRPELRGSILVPKTLFESLVARFRWQTKQQPRHRTALFAAAEYFKDPTVRKVGYQNEIPLYDHLRRPFSKFDWPTTRGFVKARGVSQAVSYWLPAYRSSYYRIFMQPLSPAKTQNAIDRWEVIFAWDPMKEEDMVRHQLRRFQHILEDHDIGLTVVYVPEHPDARRRYPVDRYQAYQRLIEEEWPVATIVDLWDFLPRDAFYDNIHPTLSGAQAITEAVLEALRPNADDG